MAILPEKIPDIFDRIGAQMKLNKAITFSSITLGLFLLTAFIKNLLPLIALSLFLAFIARQASRLSINSSQSFN